MTDAVTWLTTYLDSHEGLTGAQRRALCIIRRDPQVKHMTVTDLAAVLRATLPLRYGQRKPIRQIGADTAKWVLSILP